MKRFASFGVVGSLVVLAACQMPRRSSAVLEYTVFEPGPSSAPLWIDDVIVWPAQQNGTRLTPPLLELFSTRLHRGMRDRQYSVIARPLVRSLADQLGAAEAGAQSALQSTKADGVLVVRFTRWDEAGLLSLGRVRAEGTLKLLGSEGRVRWQGRIRCDKVLVEGPGAPRDLAERRAVAVERLAELLAARLPPHRV